MKYRAIPNLEKKIAKTEHRITEENKQEQDHLLTEVVGPNAIAEICTYFNLFDLFWDNFFLVFS